MERRWVVSPEYRLIIETVIRARKNQGVGQRELARRLGKHPSFVNKIENLERRLDVLELIAIAQAIGVPADTLVRSLEGVLPKPIRL